VRAVYAFHVKGRHWSDIGYNFVVDRFGHIFEGRAGSITKAVHGAHTGGFNTDTLGVAALGTFTTPHPPAKMVTAIAKVVAWKMGQYAIHIGGKVTLTSAGGGTDRYKAGKKITVNTLTGHRTFGRTACPGNALWAKLSSIRKQVAKIKAKQATAIGYWPVTGVWTAGGGVQPGWFRNGVWTLRKPNGSKLKLTFGAAGDTPVVGDWNGDGITSVGVYRGSGKWLLTNELTAHPAIDASFTFGETGDLPVVGLWPGQTQLGIGVVRNNIWSLRGSVSAGPAFTTFKYGRIGDLPVAADWDGDGFSTIGLLRGGTTWLLKQHTLSGVTTNTFTYGVPGADPSVADWDGNGSVTTSTVRSDHWYVRNDIKGGRHSSLVTFAPS
jgi:N-acetylmuramoyl-L-alanine amidase